MNKCVHVHVHAWEGVQVLWKSENQDPPESRVLGGCGLPDVVLGTELVSLQEQLNDIN